MLLTLTGCQPVNVHIVYKNLIHSIEIHLEPCHAESATTERD